MPYTPKTHRSQSMPKPGERPKDRRASAHKRGYGRKWAKARKRYLARNPLCESCWELWARHVPATVVDHIVPHSGESDPLFWDVKNWQGLCATCHGHKTATEDGGFGHKRKDKDDED